jgi:hypothetical protein
MRRAMARKVSPAARRTYAATAFGADRTFQKPIRARDLLTTVQDLLAET